MIFSTLVLLLLYVIQLNGLDNGIAFTPAQGWSTWNYFWKDINETLVMEMADQIVK